MTLPPAKQKPLKSHTKPEKGRLEKFAEQVDPPGREIPDRDLKDPGRMTPNAPPTDNRS